MSTEAAPSPTGTPIPSVTHQGSASAPAAVDVTSTKPISAVEKLGLKGAIQGPKEALGKAATPTKVVKEDIKRLREKHAPKINIPRADVKPAEKVEKQPVKAKVEKPVKTAPKADVKPDVEKPDVEAAKPDETPAAEVAKIKLGDKEMTAEEIEKELKELREKAEKATKSDEPDKAATSKEKEEAEKREKEELEGHRKAFLEAELAREDDIDEAGLDAILSGGPGAVKALREMRARDKMETREFLTNEVNRILTARDELIKPLLDQQQQIEKYRTEADFLSKFPEIKDNPKAIEESRKVRQEMGNYYDQIQQKISQNVASAEERLHAERYEKATAEEFNESVAQHTRERLGLTKTPPVVAPVAAAPEKTTPAATPPPKPQPKPPTGQPPGGASTPAAMNEQQMHIAKMRAAGR